MKILDYLCKVGGSNLKEVTVLLNFSLGKKKKNLTKKGGLNKNQV